MCVTYFGEVGMTNCNSEEEGTCSPGLLLMEIPRADFYTSLQFVLFKDWLRFLALLDLGQ